MGKPVRLAANDSPSPYSKPLIVLALQVVFLSALFSFYHVQIPFGPAFVWIRDQFVQIPIVSNVLHSLEYHIRNNLPKSFFAVGGKRKTQQQTEESSDNGIDDFSEQLPVFSSEQLALHDGNNPSKPVYLAILGRVFDVSKGRKHYGKGGGYHFFSGKDATRSFVSGDFSPGGLSSDTNGLSETELLSIQDWLAFYEKEYRLIGLLSGPYYDQRGRPTELLKQVYKDIEAAKRWKERQLKAQQIFPPCNSEWKKGIGGRVWCTSKSGGIVREWVGVPRKLYSPGSKQYKCVCVKNFGSPLSGSPAKGVGLAAGRGDLDHSGLAEYEDCPPDANSCRIPT